jgi:hypothetical protein
VAYVRGNPGVSVCLSARLMFAKMLDRFLKKLQGWGQVYDGDIEIALIAYDLNVFQTYTYSESLAGREPIRSGKRIEGTITQITGGYIPTGKDLRLTMEDGLKLQFTLDSDGSSITTASILNDEGEEAF